jgi:hypothetical protein
MFESRTQNLRLIKTTGILILAFIIVIFAIFRSFNYISGPGLEIYSPINGANIESSTVRIIGQASRINKITLNGNPITIDEQGNWSETLIIFPGLNTITIEAQDQFGRTNKKQLNIVGKTNQY